jgi:DNA-binding GntR family transcriptional regulator
MTRQLLTSSNADIRPISSRSVVAQVTEELRRAIQSGVLAPGQEFSLRDIATMLDVSFIPVREALRSLEAEGLVLIRPGPCALVAPLDLDDLHAIYW